MQDPWLLTPGPLTTSMSVKQSMLHDWGSRDPNFVAINTRMRARLVEMIDGAAASSPACRCRVAAPSPSKP